jgi:hypothetical protein
MLLYCFEIQRYDTQIEFINMFSIILFVSINAIRQNCPIFTYENVRNRNNFLQHKALYVPLVCLKRIKLDTNRIIAFNDYSGIHQTKGPAASYGVGAFFLFGLSLPSRHPLNTHSPLV